MENSLLCYRHNIILTVSCSLIPSSYLKTAFFGTARSDEDHSWRLSSGGETELMTRSGSDDKAGARNGTNLTCFSNRDLTMTVITIIPLARSQKSDQRQLRSTKGFFFWERDQKSKGGVQIPRRYRYCYGGIYPVESA